MHESLIFYYEVGEAELSHTCVTNGHWDGNSMLPHKS